MVEQKLKNIENLGKKELAATARQRLPPQKKNQNSEDPSGSIRDITAHLIHDKNTSIGEPCIVFNVPSAGYNPGWIYWSYEFLFFSTPGTLDPEAGTDRTRMSKYGFPKV